MKKLSNAIDRFYRHLAFGTGGLRGVLGAGTGAYFSCERKVPKGHLGNYVS